MLLKSLGHRIIPFTSSYIKQKTRDGPVFLSCRTDLKALHHSLCSLWNKRVSIRLTTLAAAFNILCLRSLQGILCFSVMLSWALGATQATPVILHCTFPCLTPGSFLNSSCQVLGCLGNHYRTKETDFTDYMELHPKLQLWSWQKDDCRKIKKILLTIVECNWKQVTWSRTRGALLTLQGSHWNHSKWHMANAKESRLTQITIKAICHKLSHAHCQLLWLTWP